MKKKAFIVGFFAGVICTIVVAANAAKIVGDNGYLIGWDVTADGEEVCSDPYIWPATMEIECD